MTATTCVSQKEDFFSFSPGHRSGPPVHGLEDVFQGSSADGWAMRWVEGAANASIAPHRRGCPPPPAYNSFTRTTYCLCRRTPKRPGESTWA